MLDDFIIDVDNMKSFTEGDGPIVVIDDDDSQLFIIETCYKKSKRDNELICMTESDEFLTRMDKVIKNELPMPELVLLDINMPGKNGFDTLKELRSYQEFKKLPRVIFTSSGSYIDIDIKNAKTLKADAFFSKPLEIADYVKFFETV